METSSGETSEEERNEELPSGEIIYDGSFAQCYSGHCNVRTVKEGKIYEYYDILR